MYSARQLTLIGKSMIINSVVLTNLWYTCSFTPLPESTLKSVHQMIFKFLWQNHGAEWISRKSAIKAPAEGGLGVVHIATKIASLRCAHAQRLLEDSPAAWKHFAVYWVGLQLRSFNPALRNMSIPHAESPNSFYSDLLSCVNNLRKIKQPLTTSDMCAEKSYYILVTTIVQPCNVVGKFPLVDFAFAWRHLSAWGLSP